MSDEKKLIAVLDLLHKKYGEGSVIDLSKSEKLEKVETMTTGLPSLDLILGGGIPKGRIIEISGPEAAGKTTMALHILAKCQKTGKKVAFLDIENAFDPDYATKIGVDMKELLLSQPNSGEEAMDIVEKLCQTGQLTAIVIDSVAQIVPMAVAAKEIDGTANIATTARLLSQTLPRLSNAAARSGTVLIFINQLRMQVGQMYGNPEITPGGRALKFAATIRLDVRASKPEERNKKEGAPIKITVKKNKIAPPFRKTELFLIYGEGFDQVADLLDSAVSVGIIEKSGGWFKYKEIKEHGWVEFCDKIKAEERLLNNILTTLKEVKV